LHARVFLINVLEIAIWQRPVWPPETTVDKHFFFFHNFMYSWKKVSANHVYQESLMLPKINVASWNAQMPQDENHIGKRSMAFAYVEMLDTQTNNIWSYIIYSASYCNSSIFSMQKFAF
jgi:hypothetical protein